MDKCLQTVFRKIYRDNQKLILNYSSGTSPSVIRAANHLMSHPSTSRGVISNKKFITKCNSSSLVVFGHFRTFDKSYRVMMDILNAMDVKNKSYIFLTDASLRLPFDKKIKVICRAISQALVKYDCVICSVGELYLATNEFKKCVSKNKNTSMVIYHNPPELYFKYPRALPAIHQIDRHSFAIMDTNPIIKQQLHLDFIYGEPSFDPDNVLTIWKNAVRTILRYFSLPIKTQSSLRVLTCNDFRAMQTYIDRVALADQTDILDHIARQESFYIPSEKCVYLGSTRLSDLAEEAAHMIKYLCGVGKKDEIDFKKNFYGLVLHEALGFLGSKIIVPTRKAPMKKDIADARRVLTNVPSAKISKTDWLKLIHVLGYGLGEALYRDIRHKRISKKEIKKLFYIDFNDEILAKRTYDQWNQRVYS